MGVSRRFEGEAEERLKLLLGIAGSNLVGMEAATEAQYENVGTLSRCVRPIHRRFQGFMPHKYGFLLRYLQCEVHPSPEPAWAAAPTSAA